MKKILIMTLLLLTTTLSAKVSEGGSNIGGGNNSSKFEVTWCSDQSTLLRQVKTRAELKLQNTGNFNIANTMLSDGMVSALQIGDENSNSFLRKGLLRGLEISAVIAEAGSPELGHRVLSSYYQFLLTTVANNLELGGRLLYITSSREQMDEQATLFEKRFVEYAKEQLEWIRKNLTRKVITSRGVISIPIGDTKTLVKISLVLLKGTTTDLEESLWNMRFSCTISDLRSLTEMFESYDQGNRELFDNDRSATTYLVSSLENIVHSLSAGACR